MTEKFTIESERINNTYSIHIRKDGEVIFEISNWNSLSEMHKVECEEFVDYLNEVTHENKELKQRVAELELLNDGLNYALKYIKKIDVEIDIGDVE